MAAYNFQKRYVPLIESGAKCQTIRQRRKNGYLPRVGDLLRLYNGMRTKSCKLIREVAVVEVKPVQISIGADELTIVLGGEPLIGSAKHAFVVADGFKDEADFAAFFQHKYGPALQAYVIRWAQSS